MDKLNGCERKKFAVTADRMDFKSTECGCKAKTLQEGYSWVPPGLSSDKIEKYFSQLPVHKVPRLGTLGEKYRDLQLIVQLPKQDLALAYCKFIERENWKHYQDFVNHRNEFALDIGHECRKCKKILTTSEIAVIAPKFGEEVAWHPFCFSCTVCDELLVDLTYCARDAQILCERHYAETIKPRCSACDEVT